MLTTYNDNKKYNEKGDKNMIVSKIYETKEEDLTAVVFEDGQCTNFIYDPEMVAALEEGLLIEAKYGFPDALPYEIDISNGNSLEDMVKLQEEESKLIAEVGEQIVVYPQHMSQDTQELFKIEIGEELWDEILQNVSGDKGVQINI